MKPQDLSLASSLTYIVLRRKELWMRISERFMRNSESGGKRKDDNKTQGTAKGIPAVVQDALLLGTGGISELRHFAVSALVSGILDYLKAQKQTKYVPFVNAVLRKVSENGKALEETFRKSPEFEERALWAGVPVWSLPAWTKTWKKTELSDLFELMRLPSAASLRTEPGKRDELLTYLKSEGLEAEPSDLPYAIRLPSTILPALVPGFERGLVTVQTEGSMRAASLVVEHWRGGLILDMCSGRGIKMGQIAQALPDARLEGWDMSAGRHLSAIREMERLGVKERVTLRLGNALDLNPQETPSLILLDAPCSGSGTWNRKPESKWQLNWQKFDRIVEVQRELLERALNLLPVGGIIIYVTCSLLRQENENVVADVLSDNPNSVALPITWPEEPCIRSGRPWGTYVWPVSQWMDGFYCSIIMKR